MCHVGLVAVLEDTLHEPANLFGKSEGPSLTNHHQLVTMVEPMIANAESSSIVHGRFEKGPRNVS